MPKITLVSILLFILLTACGTDSTEEQNQSETNTDATEQSENEPSQEPNAEEEGTALDPYDFFMPDASTATFLGEGNEYASFTLRTVFIDNDHIATYEDNGGTVMLKVYRITENRVELVKEQAEFYEEYAASSDELEALQPIRTYLAFPLELGTVIGDWVVTETNTTVDTPFENFEDVIVLENRVTENTINRTYFAKGYGEVKREFWMQEEGQDEFIVTSDLKNIDFE